MSSATFTSRTCNPNRLYHPSSGIVSCGTMDSVSLRDQEFWWRREPERCPLWSASWLPRLNNGSPDQASVDGCKMNCHISVRHMHRKPSTVLGVHARPSTKRTGELSQHKSGQSPRSAKETPVLIDSKVGFGDTGAPLARFTQEPVPPLPLCTQPDQRFRKTTLCSKQKNTVFWVFCLYIFNSDSVKSLKANWEDSK